MVVRVRLSLLLSLGVLLASAAPAHALVFGKVTIGASHAGLAANYKRVNEYRLSTPTLVSKLEVYLSPSGTTGQQEIVGVIYDNFQGWPLVLVAQSQLVTFSSTDNAGWHSLQLISPTVLKPGDYWLGLYTGDTAGVAEYAYDTEPDVVRDLDPQTFNGSASSDFGSVTSLDRYSMSLYAVGTRIGTRWGSQRLALPHAPGGEHLDVSCPAPNACLAVGGYATPSGMGKPEAATWNGSAWSLLHPPVPAGAEAAGMKSVSCTSATTCVVVGSYEPASDKQQPLTWLWSGGSWRVIPVPPPDPGATAYLNGVSCSSANACTAVGDYLADGPGGYILPFAERWDGSGWSFQSIPHSGSYETAQAVSCPSQNSCIAVGYSYSSNSGAPAYVWDGSQWTEEQVVVQGSLSGISCMSPTLCTAVGVTTGSQPLAVRFDGSAWTTEATPYLYQRGGLSDISCSSSSDCFAVGWQSNAATAVLVEHWDGTAWSSLGIADGNGPGFEQQLWGVSCQSASFCAAVGSTGSVPIDKIWDGSQWLDRHGPWVAAATSSGLDAIACPASNACISVGTSYPKAPFAESWNGTQWSLTPIPVPSHVLGVSVRSVSCPSPSACLAVGSFYRLAYHSMPLAATWNGSRWSLLSVPTPPGASNVQLTAVSCSSTSMCTAVGGGSDGAVAERWNGTSWSIQAPAGGKSTALEGVSCPSDTKCLAVGARDGDALAEVWNSHGWFRQTVASTGNAASLANISCPSTHACMAVGWENSDWKPVAQQWNGHVWSLTAPVSFPQTGAELSGLSCTSATACTAVGETEVSMYSNPPDYTSTVEHWNGKVWSLDASSPVPNLSAVSCTSATQCTIVGHVASTPTLGVSAAGLPFAARGY